MDLSTLRKTAAEITATALFELYPNIELLGGGESDVGFFYDFNFPHSVQLAVVEEKMRQIVREKRPIRSFEMMAFSAAELLRSKGLEARAVELDEVEGLVEMTQIGDFYDLVEGELLKNTAELAAFKVELVDGRIEGFCHSSKDELKKFLKKLDEYIDPFQIGERLGFWKGDIWLSKGLQKRKELIEFFKRQFFSGVVEVSGPLEGDRLEIHRGVGGAKIGEIWTFPSQETHIQVSFFDQTEGEVISCLQSIAKSLTIIGFNHSTASMGRETEYKVEDGLGRSHSVIRVKRISRKGSSRVDFYFTLVVEEVLSLIIERNLMMVELENQ